MSASSILLMGPKGVGKTTQAKLLAEHLARPRIGLDRECWAYYGEMPELREVILARSLPSHPETAEERATFLQALKDHFVRESGWEEAARIKERMELYAIRRVLERHEGAVIDFGAGHSLIRDPELLEQARRLLAPLPHVILLQPAPDPEESLRILSRQLAHRPEGTSEEQLRRYIVHPSNFVLARHVVYTDGREPRAVFEQLLQLVGGQVSA